jgi:glycosyltransferase involved in cell wall biosynthesis
VLFFNSITRAKGIFEFVEAAVRICRELPKVNVRIAGLESPDSVLVKKQIAESCAPARIHFIGAVSEEEKEAELRRADIYVLPSYIEDLPYGLLDAMALGLPCIATAVGGVQSLIEDGRTGLLIPPRDASMLAEALRQFIADPLLRRKLGAAGRQRINERYSWNRRAEEITDFYQAVLRDAPQLLPITLP